MEEKEIEIFNEFKEFLQAWNNGNYSSGDTSSVLEDFYERLEKVKNT